MQLQNETERLEMEKMRTQCIQLQEQVKGLMRNEAQLVHFVNDLNSSFITNVTSIIDEHLVIALKSLPAEHNSEYTKELLKRDSRDFVLQRIIDCLSSFLLELVPQSVKASVQGKVETRYLKNFSIFSKEQVESICTGYEKEIFGLHKLLSEITEKWRDAQSHLTEMDRQVEEQMRLLYR